MALRRKRVRARIGRRSKLQLPEARLHQPFETLVEQAIDTLPAEVRRLLDNVAIVIEDEPSREQLQTSRSRHDEVLYGLYEGTPAVEYAADWTPFPNKISLFRLTLEEDFADPDELADEVRRTLIHELAHHAGLDDRRLRDYDLD